MRVTMLLVSAVVVLLWRSCESAPDKLQADTKAPLHARSSSAARALSGQTPANTGRLRPQSKGPPPPATGGQQPQEDGVQKEESTSFKEVNGESVRVVVGNYGYQSPEGLPVLVKYMADENGNKASFTIGAAAGGAGGAGSNSRPGGAGGSHRPGTAGAGKTGTAAGVKGNQSGKNAIGGDGDRKYLPPS